MRSTRNWYKDQKWNEKSVDTPLSQTENIHNALRQLTLQSLVFGISNNISSLILVTVSSTYYEDGHHDGDMKNNKAV
jgi:hypothetical protein